MQLRVEIDRETQAHLLLGISYKSSCKSHLSHTCETCEASMPSLNIVAARVWGAQHAYRRVVKHDIVSCIEDMKLDLDDTSYWMECLQMASHDFLVTL